MMQVRKVYPFIYPPAAPDYNLPPTIYRLLNSIVNFDSEEQTKIKDLAAAGREDIFDFEYPLSTHVEKEDFEVMILNHFLMRRIGYDTLNAFKIALNVKLNEIMPIYNKMFDMLDGWDLFNDGEVTSRTLSDSGSNSLNNITSSTNTSDRRYSDTPQNNLADVRNGNYITDYNYDSDSGSVSSSTSGTDSRTSLETITRTPSDKIKIYKEFIENKKSIYTMIFEDLDVLFYGLI
jgi:hypothetical protein